MSVAVRQLGGCVAAFRPWSEADRELLGKLYMSVPRPSLDSMSAQLDRTEQSIQTEANRIGLTRPSVQLRKCMPCDKMFWSSHVHDCICPRCTDTKVRR